MPISTITLAPPPVRAPVRANGSCPQSPRTVGCSLPGVLAGTRMDTPAGARRVETLGAGDLVVDGTGALRVLQARHVLRAGCVDLVRIGPGALDPRAWLDRDTVLGAAQGVMLDDWRTRLLRGGPALVPAARLIDDMLITRLRCPDAILHLLVLDTPCVLRANGHRIAGLDAVRARPALRRAGALRVS